MTTRKPWLSRCIRAFALLACSLSAASLPAQRSVLPSHIVAPDPSAIDLGPLPGSQVLTLTLGLIPGAQRTAALDAFLAAQMRPGDPQYRHWIGPSEFAQRFGADDASIAAVSTWLQANGLAVAAVSPSNLRLIATGTVAQVAAALRVDLRQYLAAPDASGNRALYFANSAPPSVPQPLAALLASISGLDDRPPASPIQILTFPSSAAPENAASLDSIVDSIGRAVDSNAAALLTLDTSACSTEFTPSDIAAWSATLKQAQAQGITVIATARCPTGAFPASLPELTAIVASPVSSDSPLPTGIAPRPEWQSADGLPQDGWRQQPDIAVTGPAALVETLAGISRRAGTRLGNIAPVLYALAKSPGLYTHADGTAPGKWEPRDGLGLVDLKRLAEEFPAGSTGTSSLLTVSNYAPYHGQPLTLTATVTSTGGSGVPTGTVTFTSTQKGTLGTASLNASGIATFSSNSLQAGMYTTTSVYSGDANYLGSTSGVATITILGEPSLITPTVEPGAAVGGNAAIDVSITSASGVGTPTGTVTVAPQGTINPASATATLAGTNGTATARVLLPVYQAGQFTLLVSCTDPDPSFTCYSPVSLQMSVAKGATTTALAASPLDPSTGQPYTLTATVSGTGSAATSSSAAPPAAITGRATRRALPTNAFAASYTGPTGNVQFMDGTQYLATAALANGVATYTGTSTSATHSFNAMYSGDANYGTSSSTTSTTPGDTPTSTSLTASASSIASGQTVTFTAAVSSAGLPPTMTGTVTFTAAAQGVLGTSPVAKGAATLTLPGLAAGTYTVTATYSGDSVFAPSTSPTAVTVSVAAQATTIALASNVASALSGIQVMLTATVTGAATAAPTGKVSFYDSFGGVTSSLGSATLASQTPGTSLATLTITGLAPGTHSIYAVYAGDSLYLGSTSPAIPLGSTNYALTFVPTSLTLNPGQTGQPTLTVTFQGGFTGTVSFGCTPPPNIEMTCSFTPAVLNAAGTTTLVVGTVAPSTVSANQPTNALPPGPFGLRIAGGIALAILLLSPRPRQIPPLFSVLLAIAAMAALTLATGCSGSNLAHTGTPTPPDPGTSLGTQILSITTSGSDGINTVRHDLQYQVTVQ
jgi:hypothetical protein